MHTVKAKLEPLKNSFQLTDVQLAAWREKTEAFSQASYDCWNMECYIQLYAKLRLTGS